MKDGIERKKEDTRQTEKPRCACTYFCLLGRLVWGQTLWAFRLKPQPLHAFRNIADCALPFWEVVLLQHEVTQTADLDMEPDGKKRVISIAALFKQELNWELDYTVFTVAGFEKTWEKCTDMGFLSSSIGLIMVIFLPFGVPCLFSKEEKHFPWQEGI